MADAFTSFFNLIKMETNSHENDWGTQLNNNFDIIDRLHRAKVHNCVGGLLTLNEDAVLESLHLLTGALASNQVIEVPFDTQKAYFWRNLTTGAFSVNIRVAGQSGVTLKQGDTKLLYCNGTDVIDQGIPTKSDVSGSPVVGGISSVEWLGAASGTNAYSVTGSGLALVDGLAIACYFANGNTAVPVTLALNGGSPQPIVNNDSSVLGIGAIPNSSVRTLRYRAAPFTKWFMSEVVPGGGGGGGGGSSFDDITITGNVVEVPSVLADAVTILWNMAATGRNVTVTLGGTPRTLAAPTSAVVGQWGHIEFVQDAVGGRAITLDAAFDPAGSSILLDTSPNSRTICGYFCRTPTSIAIWPLYRSSRDTVLTWQEFNMGAVSGATPPPVKSVPHNLGGYPALVQVYLQCTSSNAGFSVGQRVVIGDVKDADNQRGFTVAFDATSVIVKQGSNDAYVIQSGGNVPISPSAWNVIARVFD
jgi:hypothetical protein